MTSRTALAYAYALVLACGDREAPPAARASPLEVAIAAQLGEQLGGPATVACDALVCRATLADGSAWPVEVQVVDGGWAWRIAGLVATAPLEPYLRATLADLGVGQGVRCAPRLHRLGADAPVACALEHGGVALVTIAADGSTAIELDLDREAGEARSEAVSPARERELLELSHALADGDD